MKTKISSGIYRIKNLKNDRCYYGSTVLSLEKRKKRHFSELERGKHKNQYLQNDYNKCGNELFIFEVLLFCNPQKVLIYEQKLLNLRFDNQKNCYNICPTAGNCTGRKCSEETKLKLSEASSGEKNSMHGRTGNKNPRYGKTHSEETKQKIGVANKNHRFGKKLSKEQKIKIGCSIKKYWDKNPNEKQKRKENMSGKNNPFFAKKHNKQTKEKMKKAKLDKQMYMFFNKKLNKKEICTRHQLMNKYNNLKPASISHLIIGRLKSYKGWVFIKNG